MRIVAGTHGSRKLYTLDGSNTRPTGDKVRAAMFSRVGPFFNGGIFLDLFGGSGACGLEAISRGMERAIFIEKNPKACSIIKRNVELLKEGTRVTIMKGDAMILFDSISDSLDVVFLDPPYGYEHLEQLLQKVCQSNVVSESADIIVETDSKTDLKESYGKFIKVQDKSYGLARLHFYRII